VHIGDGIKYIQNARLATKQEEDSSNGNPPAYCTISGINGNDYTGTKILIVDADSSDLRLIVVLLIFVSIFMSLLVQKFFIHTNLVCFLACSSGLTCPPTDFVEESFLLSVKEFLSGGGLFVINLVSRSPAIREMVVSKMEGVRTKWKGYKLTCISFTSLMC